MKTVVYVLDPSGQPLMPTTPVIARLLLKQGKAKVKRRCPFTIKLLYEPETRYVQPCRIAEDTGSGTFGAAAVTDDGKVCYMSEVELRNDIKAKMDARRTYRRNRRNRKARYRRPRFDNRGSSRRTDRFAPTVQSKIRTHLKEIGFIRSILPCRIELVLETGTFDPHLMKNPALYDEKIRRWGYQKGANYGFANTKAMVFYRDGYKCQHCRNKRKGMRLEAHHIVFRSNGGSDEAENLLTLCHACHRTLHDGKWVLTLKGKRKGTLSFATQMNVIRAQLLRLLPGAIETFGFITKENRQLLGLPKSHAIDAAIAASGGNPVFFATETCFRKRCVAAGDFQQTQGVRSEQPITTGKICGFRKFDKVRYLGREYFIKGRMSSGYAILMDIHGNKADFSAMPKGCKTPKLSAVTRIGARTTWMVMPEPAIVSTT